MTEETGVPEVPPGLEGVDPAALAVLREKLKKITGGETEAPTVDEEQAPEAKTEEGKDVDWSVYDLPYETKHLYPQAKLRETKQGPKWVVMLDEFLSTERSFGNHGTKVNDPKTGTKTDPLNLGEWLGDMLNSVEGWRVVSILPAGTGRVGVLLQRQYPFALTDPVLLRQPGAAVEPPSDPELAAVEDAAMKFMAAEGLTPEPSMDSLEAQALALNPQTEYDPVTGSVVRPDAVGRIKAEVVDLLGPEPPATV